MICNGWKVSFILAYLRVRLGLKRNNEGDKSGYGIYGVAFSPDGNTIVSRTGYKESLDLWRFDSLEELQTWTIANRYIPELSCAERSNYGLPNNC